MKIAANIIAIAVIVFAWAVMLTTDHAAIAWALLIGTWAVMRITGMEDGYPFDWLVKALRGRE